MANLSRCLLSSSVELDWGNTLVFDGILLFKCNKGLTLKPQVFRLPTVDRIHRGVSPNDSYHDRKDSLNDAHHIYSRTSPH